MHTVGGVEARNHLTTLLNEAEGGGEAIITRRDKPIVRIAPLETGFDRAKARAVAEGLRAAGKGQTLGGLTLKALISEGRR